MARYSWLQKIAAVIFAGIVPLIVAGCVVEPQSAAQLQDRLNNALQTNDATGREESLRNVAIDAANFNFASIASESITKMVDSTLRDETAEHAANIFDDRGDRTAAEAMVALINDGARRDKMREKFAAEPFKIPTDPTIVSPNPQIPGAATRP